MQKILARHAVVLGYDKRLCAEVLDAFVALVSRSYKRRAKALLGLASVDDALTGAVSVIQRGDSALRLNAHFHVLALDGAYVRPPDGGAPVFHALSAPTAEEIATSQRRPRSACRRSSKTAQRVQKILARHGRTQGGTGESDAEEPHGEQLALAALCGAAAAGRGLTGDRARPRTVITLLRDARSRWPGYA